MTAELDSARRSGVQKKRPCGGGARARPGVSTPRHYTQPHLRTSLERANSLKSAGEGVNPRDRRNTTRGPHADGLAPASRAQLPVGGKGAFTSELHQRAGVEEKMGIVKSVKRQAGSRTSFAIRGFDPPQPGPEYVTLAEALRMAGCRSDCERRILAGIPTVKSGRRKDIVGRRPTLIRREHAERVARVRKAADLSVEAAARVVAAELEGRI